MTLEDLLKHSNQLFSKQYSMKSLYQTLADNFFPQRADFTVNRNIGTELADRLVDSYPVLMRRDLGNSFGAMLRDGQDWFDIGTREESGYDGRAWLEDKKHTLQRLMYDRQSGFVRTTNQGDHDFATFGQCVISIEPNKDRTGLLFRNWHLRDCAWDDDENGQVGQVHRKWTPTAYMLKKIFGEDKIHSTVKTMCEKTSMATVKVRHIVIPADMYGKSEFERFKNVSLFIDVANKHIIEEVGINYPYYVVPRFQTISGSAYAYSPATVVGLPNARTLQAMTHTLLEAGERMARPPLAATQRVGDAMRDGIMGILNSAFYLDKLNLPDIGRDMTAYEVAERMKQFRREALPLFAPLESDYNGQVCEAAFTIALEFGMFGSVADIPTGLQGKDTEFKFNSPLRAQEDEQRAQQFQQTASLLGQAAEFDPGVINNFNFDESFRDAVMATGAPTKWLYDMETVTQTRVLQQAAEAQAQAEANAPPQQEVA